MRRVLALPGLLAVLAAFAPEVVHARETVAVFAPGNPHVPRGESVSEQCEASERCECPGQRDLELSGSGVVRHLPVQADTFLRLEERRVNGIDIDIYHFKQPYRLSELQLPFKILPLRNVDLTDMQLIEVTPRQALDSWFPGYAWSVLVCRRCEGRHLGWKFTPTTGNGAPFYALIVETVDGEETLKTAVPNERLLLTGLRAVGQPLAAIGLAASALRDLSGSR